MLKDKFVKNIADLIHELTFWCSVAATRQVEIAQEQVLWLVAVKINADGENEAGPAPKDGEDVEVAEPGLWQLDPLDELVRLSLVCVFAVAKHLPDRRRQVLLDEGHQRPEDHDDERQLHEQQVYEVHLYRGR